MRREVFAKADSNPECNVYKEEKGDEILIIPMGTACLAGETETVQPQSTTLSTGFVDNQAGPDFARLPTTIFVRLRGHSATLGHRTLNAAREVAGHGGFG